MSQAVNPEPGTLPARPAQDAHDAFGMNVHFGFQNPDNTNHFVDPTVDLLLELGVGRVRQRLYRDEHRTRQATRAGLQRLFAAGVRVLAPTLTTDEVTTLPDTRAQVAAYLDEIEGHPDVYDLRLIEALPGLNEPNAGRRVPPDWAQLTRIAQQALHEEVRSRPAFDQVAVQGPPLARPHPARQRAAAPGELPARPGAGGRLAELGLRGRLGGRRRAHRLGRLAARAGTAPARRGAAAPAGPRDVPPGVTEALAAHATVVGDLSRWADRIDVHIYPGDRDTLNGGPPQAFVQAVRGMYGGSGKPVTVSEYGWANATPEDPDGQLYKGGAKSCPESVTAKYAPKAPLNALLLGYQAVYAYQMLENQPPYNNDGPAIRKAKLGYIRTPQLEPSSWEPKAQFHAMKRYLALFADPGPAFTVAPLAASVRADCRDLRTMAFQRRSGEHLLALWRTVDLYQCDPRTNGGRYLEVSPCAVTVTLDRARPVAVHRPSTQDGPVGHEAQPEFTVDVADELVVLVIS